MAQPGTSPFQELAGNCASLEQPFSLRKSAGGKGTESLFPSGFVGSNGLSLLEKEKPRGKRKLLFPGRESPTPGAILV